MKTIRAEARRLLELAAGDDELRADLRALAEEILASTADASPPSEGATVAPASAEPLRELTLGQPRSPARGRSSDAGASASGDGRRSKTSPPSKRGAGGRRRRLGGLPSASGASRKDPLRPGTPRTRPGIRSWSGWIERLTDDVYWMSAKPGPDLDREPILDELAGCLETVAESLALAREAQGHSKAFESALRHVAEAQSALRRAYQRLETAERSGPGKRLRVAAGNGRTSSGLPATPHAGRRPCRALGMAVPARADRAARGRAGAGRRGWSRSSTGSESIRQRSWRARRRKATGRRSSTALDGLVAGGLPPSHREIRDLLLPIIDRLPDAKSSPTASD